MWCPGQKLDLDPVENESTALLIELTGANRGYLRIT